MISQCLLELGHNFGSEHDVQDSEECSPEKDGKYIMYPASVSGEYRNNKVSFNFKMEAQNTEGHTVGTVNIDNF